MRASTASSTALRKSIAASSRAAHAGKALPCSSCTADMQTRFIEADAAAALIEDQDTVVLMGGGGGLMEATCLFQAVERRFLATQMPRNLTVVHALGIG